MAGPRDREPPAAEEETFLSRWSRRKAEARAERPAEDRPPPADSRESAEDAAAASSEPVIRAEDLPDIDSLTAASDFKVFMQKGVPEELKTQALRKLWRLKPSLANLDGLLEYGGDYTNAAAGAAAVRTAYQIGRGFLKGEDEDQRKDQPGTDHAASPSKAEDAPAAEPHPPDAQAPTRSSRAQPDSAPPDPAADAARRRSTDDGPDAAGRVRSGGTEQPSAAALEAAPGKVARPRRPLPRRS